MAEYAPGTRDAAGHETAARVPSRARPGHKPLEPMESPIRQLIRGTSGNILVKGAGLGVTFALSLLLARILGAQGYGHFAYVLSWAHLLSVPAVMGLDVLLTRELARALQAGDTRRVRHLHRWAYRLVTTAGLALAGAYGLWVGLGHPTHADLLRWGAVLVPLLALLKLHQGSLQGWGRPVVAQVPLLLLWPAGTLGLVALGWAGGWLTAHTALADLALSAATAVGVGAWVIWRLYRTQPRAGGEAVHPPHWLSSALPLASIALFSMFNEQAGVLLLGLLSTPDNAGIFDMVRKLASLVPFVLLTTTAPLAPQIARLHAAADRSTMQMLLTRGTQLAFAGSLLVTALLLTSGPWLLTLLGPGFERGFTGLALLCAAQMFNAAMGPVAVILNMAGYERDVLLALVLAAGTHLLAGLVLIPAIPLEGAAIALGLNLLVWNALLGWRVHRRLGVAPWLRWR